MIAATYPLSRGQQGMWFVEQLRGTTSVYHDRELFRLRGHLDVDAFCAAVDLLVGRHEVLRTRFVVVGAQPRQVVDDRWGGKVRVVRAGPEAPSANQVRAFVDAVVGQPLDLERGPLFGVDLLTVDDEDHVLVFSAHHMINDGWSLRLLLTEISDFYAVLVAGGTPSAAAAPQYGEFVLWQEAELAGPERDALLAYWTKHLQDASTSLDLGSGQIDGGSHRRAEVIELDVPAGLVARLRDLARSCGATLFMALLGVFEVTLCWVCRSADVLVGVPVAGRTRPDFAHTLGCFANVLAIRADLSDGPTSAQLLRRTRENVLNGFAHQDLPFEQLVAHVNPERHEDVHPLVQATFQLVDESFDSALDLRGLESVSLPLEDPEIAYALTLDVHGTANGLRGRLTYVPSIVDPRTAQLVADVFGDLVAAIPTAGDTPVLELASSLERRRDS